MSKIISEYVRNPVTPEETEIHRLQELYMGPVPPIRFIKSVKAFWLVYVDSDGRDWPPEPYSWQPGAKRWCRINEEATGRDLDRRNWSIIGEVIMPEFVHFDVTHRKVVVSEVGSKLTDEHGGRGTAVEIFPDKED